MARSSSPLAPSSRADFGLSVARAFCSACSRAKDASSLAPIHYANDVTRKVEMFDSSDVWADRYYLTYFKGSVLLQSIRKEVGEDTFFTVLKSFQRSFEKKPAVTTDEFIGLLSFVTKKDWKPWFEKYYYGSEMP